MQAKVKRNHLLSIVVVVSFEMIYIYLKKHLLSSPYVQTYPTDTEIHGLV